MSFLLLKTKGLTCGGGESGQHRLKDLFHPAFLARAVSWLAFLVSNLMAQLRVPASSP